MVRAGTLNAKGKAVWWPTGDAGPNVALNAHGRPAVYDTSFDYDIGPSLQYLRSARLREMTYPGMVLSKTGRIAPPHAPKWKLTELERLKDGRKELAPKDMCDIQVVTNQLLLQGTVSSWSADTQARFPPRRTVTLQPGHERMRARLVLPPTVTELGPTGLPVSPIAARPPAPPLVTVTTVEIVGEEARRAAGKPERLPSASAASRPGTAAEATRRPFTIGASLAQGAGPPIAPLRLADVPRVPAVMTMPRPLAEGGASEGSGARPGTAASASALRTEAYRAAVELVRSGSLLGGGTPGGLRATLNATARAAGVGMPLGSVGRPVPPPILPPMSPVATRPRPVTPAAGSPPYGPSRDTHSTMPAIRRGSVAMEPMPEVSGRPATASARSVHVLPPVTPVKAVRPGSAAP